MAPAVLLRGGGTLYWVVPGRGPVAQEPIDPDPERAAQIVATGYRGIPEARRRRWTTLSDPSLGAAEPLLVEALAQAGARIALASTVQLREARALLPARSVLEERRFLLPLAQRAVAGALGGAEETLIALAREEARVERALGREQGAADQWVPVDSGPLADHAEAQRRFSLEFVRYHRDLEGRLERVALVHLPNLSALVGAKIAARLLAAAGSRRALARMSSSRLQLLGARRRPSPDRGPRFGVIYRAAGLDQLPPEAQGRYARSLASLAVIAARADGWTQRDLGSILLLRRDRRRSELGGGRS